MRTWFRMNRSTKCSICLVFSGVVLTIFGFVLGYAIFPAVVEMLIREELDIWNPESEGRKNFVSIIAIEIKVST